ncbi:hypothetical protein N7X28_28425 [Bacillus sp. SM-B1]|uniref:hypothetical protein n=1 Tax=Bacillus sp. SM-B1 TaxID=2980102 RepID=UPI00294967DD|nr:hypothetical protein [Bacillus sp. SM-B1]MDV6040346.1 hypothetical protein [Bacillus sp. SM-B1]
MKKKQVNVDLGAELFKGFAEGLAKGLEKEILGTTSDNPFDNMFSEIKNDQMNQVYEGYKTVGEMLFNMKEGLVSGGFTEEQAMDIVIQEYLEQRAEAKG